ncbi:hypothetical protein HGA13_28115 [Nocardia speluncae]|uniref:Potassium/proton antiporter subunit KhtT-like N-terminal domain-containing protein n=1 Tax=Nocardia speluncae TaxID=419477 RepID=A0A846XNM5_9NOCA|nr:hypothetical protein [Nocardia speluncae]NKY36905.1 hypothetical protein [Nocardia speluncae]
MHIDRSTIPGQGAVHHLRTRSGDRFALVTSADGGKNILVYHGDGDEPVQSVALGTDEADQFADLLHSAPLPDRVARLERLVDRLTGDEFRP